MAAQAGLCLAWSETPEDTFCRVVAQMMPKKRAKNKTSRCKICAEMLFVKTCTVLTSQRKFGVNLQIKNRETTE